MGGFYNSFHVRGKTQQEVCNEITMNDGPAKCIIGIAENGWVPVYAELGFGDGLAPMISERMQTTVILIDIHDDDFFCYSHYRNGKLIDEFNSCPDYFGETLSMPEVSDPEAFLQNLAGTIREKYDISTCKNHEEFVAMAKNINSVFREAGFTDTMNDKTEMTEAEDLSGHPERFAYLLEKPEDIVTLAEILRSMQDQETVFVSMPGQQFCDLLRLPNAINSYQYLLDDGIPEGYVLFD